MTILVQSVGALLGFLAVLFGAFGAHALKKYFTIDQLKSFETGVTYQMYHAIVLLVVGYNFSFDNTSTLSNYMAYCFILGTLLFSFSIYGLCFSAAKGKKLKFLGPITPIGGVLLVIGWGILLYLSVQSSL